MPQTSIERLPERKFVRNEFGIFRCTVTFTKRVYDISKVLLQKEYMTILK